MVSRQAPRPTKTIRIFKDTHADLNTIRRGGESWNDFIERLAAYYRSTRGVAHDTPRRPD